MTLSSKKMKVALVYDRVNKWGGAERVIIALRKLFPDSVLFTSVYKTDRASWAKKIPVFTSFLQKIPLAASHHEALGTVMPIAFETFNFDEFDLVISVTSEAAKGIITKPQTAHISIILTPTRYLWSGYNDYFENELFRTITLPFVYYLRIWDKIAAARPDKLIAISKTVQARIKKYYGLESEVIYPPLMIRANRPQTTDRRPQKESIGLKSEVLRQKYFLVVSRLVPYKRVDIAVAACTKLDLPLIVIGSGNEYKKLKKIAGPTIKFLKYVTDSELKQYYANCRALIFPGVEDFGLTMVEAQAHGKPVIAFRAGGASEIVIDGKTGEFFDKQNAQALVEVLKKFKAGKYNKKDCIKNSKRFSYEQFAQKIMGVVNAAKS